MTLALVETAIVPAHLAPAPERTPIWVAWLAEQPPGAVAVVPFPENGSPQAYEATTIMMLQALEHRHPLVNGYSGFFPGDYLRLRRAMANFPDEASLRLLMTTETRYLVIDHAWLTQTRQERLNSMALHPLYSDTRVRVYQLTEVTRSLLCRAVAPCPPEGLMADVGPMAPGETGVRIIAHYDMIGIDARHAKTDRCAGANEPDPEYGFGYRWMDDWWRVARAAGPR
ncbi:hypothetical protein HC891_23670 [Candidatus Gracilibacteria bacterium]|nr:hypothetical protein [Candidatus Gracilibacteria bacterium]